MNILNPQAIGSAILQAVQQWFNPLSWIRQGWKAVGSSFFDGLVGYVTSTKGPLSGEGLTTSATVVHYTIVTRAVADALVAGVLVWAFIGVMWQSSSYGHYRLRALLPRLLLATVLVNFSLPLAQGLIDLNRALAQTIVLNAGFSLQALWGDMTNEFLGTPFAPALFVSAAMLVGLALLAFVYLLRYALLTVLVITAPLAALLFVLHETSHHARQWMTLFLGTLFMQPLQLLILGIGWNLDAHAFGSNPLRHLFALACLLLCFRVPGVLSMSGFAGRHAASFAHREAGHALKALGKVHA